MTKQELITILSKTDSRPSIPVVVTVEYPDGTHEFLDIDTFTIYSNTISLNVKSESDTTSDDVNMDPDRPITEKDGDVEEADDRWMYDFYYKKQHNHFLKKLDCIIYEDSKTHEEKPLFVTSFDYDADYAARGITQYSSSSWYVAAPCFTKYRFATEDEIMKAVNSLDAQTWSFAGAEFKDKYREYLKTYLKSVIK